MPKRKNNKKTKKKIIVYKHSMWSNIVTGVAFLGIFSSLLFSSIMAVSGVAKQPDEEERKSSLMQQLDNLGLTDKQIAEMLGEEYATPSNLFSINEVGVTDEDRKRIEESEAAALDSQNSNLYVGQKVIVSPNVKVGDKLELYDDYMGVSDEPVDINNEVINADELGDYVTDVVPNVE